ncbi:MAG: hypothetical protein M1837_002787 [Sclerophora amabilis]|nr:MAG: hypothetical protein M1837_002787 [Sclerophora amabilis]
MTRSVESARPMLAPSVSPRAGRSRDLLSPERSSTLRRSRLFDRMRELTPFEQASANRASQRFSTYSASPSVAFSDATMNSQASSSDPRVADIKSFTEGLDRLDNKRLQQQRYTQTSEQSDNLSQLALQAKLDRALGRRMTSQDAVLRVKRIGEKQGALA